MPIRHDRYFLTLCGIFSLVWILLAIAPHDRADWALENALVAIMMVLLLASWKKFPLSRISYTTLFVFLCLHELGAHYTYARTPYNEWLQSAFGFSLDDLLGFQRNHYDRLVHFCYGLLLAYPVREVFIRIVQVKGFWGYFLPFDLTLSSSAFFELFEWGAAELFGGDLGIAYLGTQGDIWDAQKDMALASLGAGCAMSLTALINHRLQRDFAEEWRDSLKIKNNQPLGEDKIIEMWEQK